MFDHYKCVSGWTTMACHVYNSFYVRIMIIVVCDMYSKDVDSQIQSMEIHINTLIQGPHLWAKHMEICKNYKNSKTLAEANANFDVIGIGGIHLVEHQVVTLKSSIIGCPFTIFELNRGGILPVRYLKFHPFIHLLFSSMLLLHNE